MAGNENDPMNAAVAALRRRVSLLAAREHEVARATDALRDRVNRMIEKLRPGASPTEAKVAPAPGAAPAECAICFEKIADGAAAVQFCGSAECEARFCGPCAAQTICSVVGERKLAFCPRVRCPGCSAFVPFLKWRAHAPPAQVRIFQDATRALLSIQCGNCHRPGTLLPVYRGDALGRAETELGARLGSELLARHMRGERGAAEALAEAVLAMAEEDEAKGAPETPLVAALEADAAAAEAEFRCWVVHTGDGQSYAAMEREATRLSRGAARRRELRRRMESLARPVRKRLRLDAMRHALKRAGGTLPRSGMHPAARRGQRAHLLATSVAVALLEDDERRAVFLAAFYRLVRNVRTKCCGREHCFPCQVKGGHTAAQCERTAKTAAAVAANSEIRLCPNCRVPIVKSEGCGSVTCPACHHGFSFLGGGISTDA